MTILYSEDFESFADGTLASSAGWSGSDVSVIDVAGNKRLGRNVFDVGSTQRAFATGGTFSYDWWCETGDETLRVLVNGSQVKLHVGAASGSDSITIANGDTVEFEFNIWGGSAHVDNLSLDGIGNVSCDPKPTQVNLHSESIGVTPDYQVSPRDTQVTIESVGIAVTPDTLATPANTSVLLQSQRMDVSPVAISPRNTQVSLNSGRVSAIPDTPVVPRNTESVLVSSGVVLSVNGVRIKDTKVSLSSSKVQISLSEWRLASRPRRRLFFTGGLFIGN